MRLRLLVLTLLVASIASASAQEVEVREVDPAVARGEEAEPELVYLEGSAMEVTLNLPAHLGDDVAVGYGKRWSSTEMARYVVDKARIRQVAIERRRESKKKDTLSVAVALTTEWFYQDVDLVVEIREKTADRVLYAKTFDVSIGGSGTSGVVWGAAPSQTPTATWDLKGESAAEMQKLLADGSIGVRVALAIDDE